MRCPYASGNSKDVVMVYNVCVIEVGILRRRLSFMANSHMGFMMLLEEVIEACGVTLGRCDGAKTLLADFHPLYIHVGFKVPHAGMCSIFFGVSTTSRSPVPLLSV